MSDYYSEHSSEYIATTMNADLSTAYALFEPLLKELMLFLDRFLKKRISSMLDLVPAGMCGGSMRSLWLRWCTMAFLASGQAPVLVMFINESVISKPYNLFMDYPALVKRIREDLLITQTELAEMLGIAFATVNRRENGHHKPTIKQKGRLGIFAGNTR